MSKKTGKIWTEKEIDILKTGYAAGVGVAEVAREIGRTRKACASKYSELRTNGTLTPSSGEPWSVAEIARARLLRNDGRSSQNIANTINGLFHTNRSARAVSSMILKTDKRRAEYEEKQKTNVETQNLDVISSGTVKYVDENADDFLYMRICRPDGTRVFDGKISQKQAIEVAFTVAQW